jgi:hypothetical protein
VSEAAPAADALVGLLGELDALSGALAQSAAPDGVRTLQLVQERQQVLDRLGPALAAAQAAPVAPARRAALARALERSAHLGELARRAVQEQARQVAREQQALVALLDQPEALAAVGRIDAHG